MTERKMASVRTVAEIKPIPDADLICAYRVDGWWVVDTVGKYKVGDLVVYFEIDSWIPTELAPFLSKGHEPRSYNDVKGEKLRTVRLRKQISQGLILPISIIDVNECGDGYQIITSPFIKDGEDQLRSINILADGLDVTKVLNIQKWEAVIPSQLAGQAAGNFPSFIPKTDEERCQNIQEEIFVDNINSMYEVSIKLDGTSFTAFYVDGEEGVCSRNWELKLDGSNESNAMVRMYIDSGMQASLRYIKRNIAVQGELMGPSIQGNREGFTSTKLFIFNIYDIDGGCYFTPSERYKILKELHSAGMDIEMVKQVPLLAFSANLKDSLGIITLDQLLRFAEGPSVVHTVREGLVFKSVDGGFSFKAISNSFLLKSKE